MLMRAIFLLAGIATLASVTAQTNGKPTLADPPKCASMVIIKCDKPDKPRPSAEERTRQETMRRNEARRAQRGVIELDRVIIEGEAELPGSPEEMIARALLRAPVRAGETSFATGESAQCTCMNICPPPPFPCCQCTDRVGSRLSSSPGWAPTR
jgi:hypothetical protein